jgi:flagellar assembly protein FliH
MASVIKSTLGARNAGAVAFNFEDVAQHANQYVGEVQARANAIVAEARAQAAAVTQRSENEGREAAMRAAEKVLDEKVGQRMETLLPALEKVVAELTDAKQAWLRHWEASAIHLAAKVAARVVRRELEHDPQITIDLVREALEMSAGSSQVKILLNPTDFETLGGNVKSLCAEIARSAKAEVIADATVSPGGCRLETQHGVIDQQIESQLDRIAAELIGYDQG